MLQSAYNTLLQESGSETKCQLMVAETDMIPWNAMSASESEITVIFCICVLAEIGNSKSNIIGVCFTLFHLVDALVLSVATCTGFPIMNTVILWVNPSSQFDFIASHSHHL